VSLEVRVATAKDVPLIHELMRGLAVYEKLEHAFVSTPADLNEALFGARPVCDAILAELDGTPVGFALYFTTYSTFVGRPGIYLEDLFVLPEHRGKGAGKALLARLAAIAVERKCARLEWAVLDWNEPSIGFYKSLGAVPMDEWTVYRMTGDALAKLAAS